MRQQKPSNNEGLFVTGTYEPTSNYPGSQLVGLPHLKVQMKAIATSVLIFCSWRQIIHPMRHGMSAQTKDSAGVRVPGFSPGAPPHQKKPLRKEKMPSVDTGCFRLLGSPATWTSRTVSPTSPRVALTIRPTSGRDQCYSVCVRVAKTS